MGGLVSSPVDESTKKEIEDAIKDLLGTFTKEYVKYYAIGLVQKIKEEAQAEPDGYKLLVREESKDNRKVGTVLKEGGVLKKAFNQRYFVVKHDWMIDYYASEEDSKKEKAKPRATISLCGYHVNPDANDTVINRLKKLAEKMGMNFDELPKPKEYPKGTIELHHSRRQSYYITIENDEERKQWVETFQDACRYAYGLKNKDRVHKFAFNEAVRRTRWHTGAWGWWSWGGTEEQILSDLISDYIDWKIMYKIYGKITGPWMIRNTVRNQVLKVLDKTILAAVTPAWKAMAATVEALRPKIEPVIKENLSPLFKLQKELQDKMKDGAMSIINPILSEHVTPHLSKIVEVIKSPMVEAFDVNFKQYEEQINKYDFKGGKDDAQKGFHELNYFPRSWHMWKAFDKVDPMYDPLWALHIVFEDIYPWSLIWTARDTLREKMDNAMYTFEVKLIEELEKGEQKDSRALIDFVKAKVMADYQDDAKLATINYYREIIKAIVMPPFQKKVFPACEAILAPIGDLIPEPFKQFCDPGQMFTEVLQGIIDESINNVLGAN